jgi:catechol 2,3-dioxygenase-like lactoylglutathione lyase family enzyme
MQNSGISVYDARTANGGMQGWNVPPRIRKASGNMADAVRLEHVGIPVSVENFDEVEAFYNNNFGWNTVRTLAGPPRIAFISDGAGGRLELYVAAGNPMTDPVHLAFAVPIDQFETITARLRDSGVTFDVETQNEAGDRLAFFNDPAGNRAQIVGRVRELEM